jgi:hypothetical protein
MQPIDLRSIQKLKGVRRNGHYVVVVAMITQHELQASEVIAVSLRTLDAGRQAC